MEIDFKLFVLIIFDIGP